MSHTLTTTLHMEKSALWCKMESVLYFFLTLSCKDHDFFSLQNNDFDGHIFSNYKYILYL